MDPSDRTWASPGKKEDCDGLPSIMAERPRLSRRQFDDFVDLPPQASVELVVLDNVKGIP